MQPEEFVHEIKVAYARGRPMTMCSIPTKTVDDDHVLTGFPSENFIVRSQPKGFTDTEISKAWL
jgi:hypothetical protein